MNIKNLDDNFSISEQISLEDVKMLAAKGVKTIICNRPDNEEPNQLSYKEISDTAKAHGIDFAYIPAKGRDIPEESLEAFSQLFENRSDKKHAYCRTGARSSIFWNLSQAKSNVSG